MCPILTIFQGLRFVLFFKLNTLRFMKSSFIALLTILFFSFAHAQENGALQPTLLPSKFLNGERFYIKLATESGDSLLGFCDTGGGISFTFTPLIKKLNLGSKVKRGYIIHIIGFRYIPFNDLVNDKRIPALSLKHKLALTRHFKKITEPVFIVFPIKGEIKFLKEVMKMDVFLAQNFFMDKSWTFDYPGQQIWVNTPISLTDTLKPDVQKLGFKKDEHGIKKYGLPSMKIEVDSEIIDVLFDSGATIILSKKGKDTLHNNETTIGGSFIARSLFDKWHARHPEWKYYEKADYNNDVIEVPQVKIGVHIVGPVLFAKRPDEAWSQSMIHTMDKVVKGAIGGSALKYLRVTIDYNSELIKFKGIGE